MGDPGEEKTFRDYLTSAGSFVHEGISLLADDSSKGRKVIASQELAKGTELLRIPTDLCFFSSPTRPPQQVITFRTLHRILQTLL